MDKPMIYAIVAAILVVALIYLIAWSVAFFRHNLYSRRQELDVQIKEKQKAIRHRAIGFLKDYWFNKKEVEEASDNKDVEEFYHYFSDINKCVRELIIEMYDSAIVRTEDLEKVVNKGNQGKSNKKKNKNKKQGISDNKAIDIGKQTNVRQEIYDLWNKYVDEFFEIVCINCNEEMKAEIIKDLREYGYNDLEVLLHSPE